MKFLQAVCTISCQQRTHGQPQKQNSDVNKA